MRSKIENMSEELDVATKYIYDMRIAQMYVGRKKEKEDAVNTT